MALSASASELQRGSGAERRALPADYFPTGFGCWKDVLVVSGHVRPSPTGADREAQILTWTEGASDWTTRYSERGARVTGFSTTEDGASFALVGDLNASRLLRSVDQGMTWTEVAGAPGAAWGSAFASARLGFLWNSKVVAVTRDGGQRWAETAAPLAIQFGSPWPIAAADGSLWLATLPESGPHAHLLRMRADLTTGLARDLEDGIDAMAASGENAWLLGREGGYGRAFLAKIAAGSETLARVSEFGDDLPLAVAARGSTLAVLLAHVTESASAHYVTWSRDGGKTWSRADAEAGQRVCIDPGGRIWVAGRSAVWLEGE